jgi:membrane fusion protein, copper/silver efflux system
MRTWMIIILLLAVGCTSRQGITQAEDTYYTCSMDPQVVEALPGKCPICKMDLTPVKKSSTGNDGVLALSEQQIMLGNIRVDTIKAGRLGERMVLTATLNFDQMKAVSVSSRVMGRIEKLYVRNQGDYVRKGMPLFDIYSEELNNAKQEYLLALDKQKTFGESSVVPMDELVRSARNKLLLWGVEESQIRALEQAGKAGSTTTYFSKEQGYVTSLDIREGDYVMEGGTVVRLADLNTLWAEAQVYTSQLADLDRLSTAMVELPDLDGKQIQGKISFVNPEINPETRINLIRVSIPNQGLQLKPGMPAYVILKSPARRMLSLPIDAVIRDGQGAKVWIQSASRQFRPVEVKTGQETDYRIEIVSGLREGDVVVLTGAYLLHSEWVFRKGVEMPTTHQH